MSMSIKSNQVLEEAKAIASRAPSWADFSAHVFGQEDGLIAKHFPDELQRQAFYDTPQYRELNHLLVELMRYHGVVEGAKLANEKSGKFVVRVPKTIHQKLEIESKREGVSLNQLAVAKLSLPLRDELGLSEDLIAEAFNAVHDGYSTDYVIIHPELDRRFLDRCATFNLGRNERLLNQKLMNIRKTSKNKGKLNPATKRAGITDYDKFEFAAEIAVRTLQRVEGVSLDMILCDPAVRQRFDEIASQMCSGYTTLHFRAAALNLRKGHRLKPIDPKVQEYDLVSAGPVRKIDLSKLSDLPGVYALYDANRPIFAGSTDNLRERLFGHLHGGLPDWIIQDAGDDLIMRSLVLPSATKEDRLNWLSRFINREKPLLNYQKAA